MYNAIPVIAHPLVPNTIVINVCAFECLDMGLQAANLKQVEPEMVDSTKKACPSFK